MDISFHSQNLAKSIAARERMRRVGFTPDGGKLWTAAEDDLVRTLYPDYAAMRKRLPGRTLNALHERGRKLGVAKRLHWWLASDISKLRRLYPTASRARLMEEFAGLLWERIESAALRNGIRRAPRKHRRTGSTLIDAILTRIEEIGWTLSDLDEQAHTKKYFQNHGWRRWKPSTEMIGKAVKALDGRIEIHWN